jgi:Leucine-rich repeat (LRR) protein/GTPase SAR1 family protein
MSEIALRLIENCFKTKDPSLDLGNCELNDTHFIEGGLLDQALRKCIHLEVFILSNQWFSHDNEHVIYSSNNGKPNHFNSYPPAILVLGSLKTIIIGGYFDDIWGITDMYFVSHLFNLRKLNLSFNQISGIYGLYNLSFLEELNLNCNQIKELKNLENLKRLKYLSFYDNQVTKLQCLENLSVLEGLDASKNNISELKGLEKLVLLKELVIYNNEIVEIQGIETLRSLKQLFIGGNKIREIKGLEASISLQWLNIPNNQIKEIKGLDSLTSLKRLELDGNEISEAKGLESLVSLTELNLFANQINDLTGLENLANLQQLNIADNQINSIEPLIPLLKKNALLKIVFGLGYGDLSPYEINISNNPLISPPIEIAKQGSRAISNYFAELKKVGTEYLYEAKMLIVGQPRAGKTSLRYKLFDSKALLPKEDQTTRGIDIKKLHFDIVDRNGNRRKFNYNVWDFGGQQIYQTTHQFFLTHRSLYILVLDTGKDSIGNDDNTINYWLQALELLGGNSPLLLVRNEKNERQVYIDFPQKQARFNFLRRDYNLDLNALIPATTAFNSSQLDKFNILKEDIETELKRLPLVGFPMPKNWVEIRNELMLLSKHKHYITRKEFIDICNRFEVTEFARQMELSHIFHDLGVFLHFQDYHTLEEFIILQNIWATDAVFAVYDNSTVRANKGSFSDADLSEIWQNKRYDPSVHKRLLALMMQFELCYLVDKSSPNKYIIPEMLSDNQPEGYSWEVNNDLPLQYRYDFMPKGILTRLIVRLHKHIALQGKQQVVWKTGVKIDSKTLDCPNTFAEITEAWNNKQLDIRVQGPFAKDLMNKITFQIDELNNEFFRQVSNNTNSQKSKWYKMIPCNCVSCKDNIDKHFYDYRELIDRKGFGKTTIECKRRPFVDVNIGELLDGFFIEEKEKSNIKGKAVKNNQQTITIFLASSSELKTEREQFELFLSRENKRLNKKGIFLNLEIWEDFLDHMSQTRLQDEYNKVIKGCDVFVMLYFSKVGKYTAEEFETAFKQFREADKPKIYTYFKKADVNNASINRDDLKSVWAFQDKLKELGHFQTEFDSDAQLHLHFKKQLERLYDI